MIEELIALDVDGLTKKRLALDDSDRTAELEALDNTLMYLSCGKA